MSIRWPANNFVTDVKDRIEIHPCLQDDRVLWVLLRIDGTTVGRFSSEEIARDYANNLIAKGKTIVCNIRFIK